MEQVSNYPAQSIVDSPESNTLLHHREWWTLKQCCERKGLSYKSACNRTTLQPRRGVPDGYLSGRKVWHRTTVEKWLPLTDHDHVEGGAGDE